MKFSNIVILLGCCIGLGQVKQAVGLWCYNCIYDEADPSSSQTCEHSPTTSEIGQSGSIQYCATWTGLRNGKKYVQRGGLTSNGQYPDKFCDDTQPGNGVSLDYPRLCRCKSSLCNVGDWDSAAVGGIRCYSCTYIQGDPSTSQACEDVPADTETVFGPGHPAIVSTRITSNRTTDLVLNQVGLVETADYAATLESTELDLGNSFASKLGGKPRSPNYPYTYCYIQMGELNGKKYVRRHILDSTYVYDGDFCKAGMPSDETLPLTNPKMCMCNTKKCNVGDWGAATIAPPIANTTTTTTTRRTTTTKRTTPRPPTTPEEEEEEDLCPTEDPVTETPGEDTTERSGENSTTETPGEDTTESSDGNSTTENPDFNSTRSSRRRQSRAKCGAGDVSLSAILVLAGLIFAATSKIYA